MKVFFSKKGFWLSLILWIPSIASLLMALYEGEYIAFIVLAFVFSFITWLWFDTRYTIKDTEIEIKCGPFSYPKVPIESIKKISHSRSAISAPACSLDRLLISYNKYDDILISPKNEDRFIQILLKKNPNIKYTTKK